MLLVILAVSIASWHVGTACPDNDIGQLTSVPDNLPTLNYDQYAVNRLQVHVGQSFMIRLLSNPTTGYSWYFTQDPKAVTQDSWAGKLSWDGCKYERTPVPVGFVGSGGHEHWIFTPKETGEFTISLKYTRSWNPDEGVPVHFHITSF